MTRPSVVRLPHLRDQSTDFTQPLLTPNLPDFSRPIKVELPGDPSSNQIAIVPRRKGISWVGLIPTTLVIIISFGLGSTLLLWLIMHQAPMFQSGLGEAIKNGTFIVDEGSMRTADGDSISLLRALTFSALASHLITLTSSFLMTLVAYRSAGQWLRVTGPGQESPSNRSLTPLQYGLLSDLLATSSLAGIYRSVRYTFRRRYRRAALPRILLEALAIAIIVLILTHSLGIVDFWLHSTSRTIVTPLSVPLTPETTIGHGIAFNQTFCDEWNALASSSYPCFHSAQGWSSVYEANVEAGWALSYNITPPITPFRPITLAAHNDTAILVPLTTTALSSSPTFKSEAFTFTSFGAQASCKIITGTCSSIENTGVVDCGPIGYPSLPLRANGTNQFCGDNSCLASRIFGVIDNSIGIFNDGLYQTFPANASTPPNPVQLLVQLKFGNSGTIVVRTKDVIDIAHMLYAACDLTYLNVTAHYDPVTDSFNLLSSTPSSPELASILWGPLIAQYASDRLAADVQGSALIRDITTVTALLNQDLGRLAIGWVGGLFMPIPATESWSVTYAVLGQYPIGPVFAVVGILYTYSFLAIFIFFSTAKAASYSITTSPPRRHETHIDLEERALVLGQMWLGSSLPFIGWVFQDGATDARRSVAEDSLDMVRDDDSQRLALGVHDRGNGNTVFGLRRRIAGGVEAGGWKRRGLILDAFQQG